MLFTVFTLFGLQHLSTVSHVRRGCNYFSAANMVFMNFFRITGAPSPRAREEAAQRRDAAACSCAWLRDVAAPSISLCWRVCVPAGDICHLLSFVVMFWKLHTSKSVAGISLKTQELYAIVFLARYLDLFWNFLSMYNVVMKIIFIISSMSIVYIIRFGVPHKDTYNAEDDAFPYLYLIVPAALLGVAINQDYSSPFEMCWAFSIYLEAVAILPQLFMLQKQGPPRHVEA